MAVVFQGAVNHLVKPRPLYPHGSQPLGQAQAGVHVCQSRGNVAGAGQAHGVGHFFQALLALHGLRLRIERDDCRQKHGVERAVVQAWLHTAQAVAEAVHTAQAFLKRHGALHAGTHQLAAGLGILPVARGALNVGPATGQTIQRNTVCRWVERGRHKGFHAMGNCIHARGGREHGGQAVGEFGVANGGFGHQVPAVKAQLAVVVDDDDGAARYLAAGAAGGGHGNDGRYRLGDAGRAAFDGGIGGQWPGVGGGNRYALGTVNRAAPAHGDQPVAALLLVELGGRAHGGLGGVAGCGIKDGHGHIAQGIQCFLQHACCFDASIGHHQGVGDAHALALLRQQAHGAKVELNLRDVVDKSHLFTPSTVFAMAGSVEQLRGHEHPVNPEWQAQRVTQGTSHWAATAL